jgi:hypothetical protein
MSRALGLRGSLGLDDSGRPISSKIDEGIASLSSALCAAGRSLELATYTIDCRASAPPRVQKRSMFIPASFEIWFGPLADRRFAG